MAASTLVHALLGYVLGSSLAVGMAVNRIVSTTQEKMLPGWVQKVGMLAVYTAPTVGFVALGPMWRNVVGKNK